MRRAPAVIGATIAGVAAIISFHPQRQADQLPLAAASGGGDGSTGQGGGGASQAASSTAGAGSALAVGASAPQTIDGSVETTPYGPVQIQITVQGGQLTDVQAIQLPTADSRSYEISSQAGPILSRQALTAQTAQIDGVSGASYTSAGYEASLASAISQIPSGAIG
jgi:uncharacterized protein with FMN-binding domain